MSLCRTCASVPHLCQGLGVGGLWVFRRQAGELLWRPALPCPLLQLLVCDAVLGDQLVEHQDPDDHVHLQGREEQGVGLHVWPWRPQPSAWMLCTPCPGREVGLQGRGVGSHPLPLTAPLQSPSCQAGFPMSQSPPPAPQGWVLQPQPPTRPASLGSGALPRGADLRRGPGQRGWLRG